MSANDKKPSHIIVGPYFYLTFRIPWWYVAGCGWWEEAVGKVLLGVNSLIGGTISSEWYWSLASAWSFPQRFIHFLYRHLSSWWFWGWNPLLRWGWAPRLLLPMSDSIVVGGSYLNYCFFIDFLMWEKSSLLNFVSGFFMYSLRLSWYWRLLIITLSSCEVINGILYNFPDFVAS